MKKLLWFQSFILLATISLGAGAESLSNYAHIDEINILSDNASNITEGPGRIEIVHDGRIVYLPLAPSKKYLFSQLLSAKQNGKMVRIEYKTTTSSSYSKWDISAVIYSDTE